MLYEVITGHTEYLADLSGQQDALMLMVADKLRVGLVTTVITSYSIHYTKLYEARGRSGRKGSEKVDEEHHVITSYSIHYTKLYESVKCLSHRCSSRCLNEYQKHSSSQKW